MNEAEYIGINEFSKSVKRTEQSVYKRLRNPGDVLHNYTRYNEETGNLEIQRKAREVYEKKANKQSKLNQEKVEFSQYNNKQEHQAEQKQDEKDLIIEMLRQEIAELHQRLAEANTLIKNQQEIAMLKERKEVMTLAEKNKTKHSFFRPLLKVFKIGNQEEQRDQL